MHNSSKYFGLFAGDSWRAKSNFTLNYGLRWEVSTPWVEKDNQYQSLVPGLNSRIYPGAPTGYVFPGDFGIPRGTVPTRYNNFAPRLGIAYAPEAANGFMHKLLGDPGNTSIRASFGMYYTSLQQDMNSIETGDAPFGLYYISPVAPLYATPFIDRATGASQGQRYPIPPLVAGALVNWSQFLPIASSPVLNPGNRLPYAESYMFSIQRQIGQNSFIGINYVGTQGRHLIADLEANPADPALCLSLSQPSQLAAGSQPCGPNGEDSTYITAAGQVIHGTRTVFPPTIGSNGYFATSANSSYNALEATFRRTAGRLEFLAAYTYSKSIDNASDWLASFSKR